MLRLAYAVLIPLLCFALWVGIDLGGTRSAQRRQPLVGSSDAALVGYVVGAEVLPRGRLVVGPSWIRAHHGVVHAHRYLVGGISLPDTHKWPDRVVRVDPDGCVADIGAYFAGRRFGQHALAAAISPAKTWEGFWGGMLGVAALAYSFRKTSLFHNCILAGALCWCWAWPQPVLPSWVISQ